MYKQSKTSEEYLLQRCNKTDSCWIFIGSLDKDGYGQVHSAITAKNLKCTRAHQMAYLTWKGEFDRKLFICHTCHNPSCINPDHLYAGTALENNQDMVEANRQKYLRGEESYKSKLAWDEVQVIRSLKGTKTCFEVSKKFNISFGHVCRIWRNERYKSKV